MAPAKKKNEGYNEGQRNTKKFEKDDTKAIDDNLDPTNLEVSEAAHSSKVRQPRNSKEPQNRDDENTDSEISEHSLVKNNDHDGSQESDDMTEMEVDGLNQAKKYIIEALDFGINSGFLEPKDKVGNLLRVSSEIMNFRNSSPSLEKVTESSVTKKDEDVHEKTSRKRRRSRSRKRSRKGTMKRKRTRRARSHSISHEQAANTSRRSNEHIVEKTKTEKKIYPDEKEPIKTTRKSSSRSSKTNKQIPESKNSDDDDLDETDQDCDVTDVYRKP